MVRFKPLFKPGVIAFFAVVPVLLVTALVTVPDPVCGGTGFINGTPGVENVKIVDMSYKEVQSTRDACGVYNVYKYTVTLQLLNEGSDEAAGWLKVALVDVTKAEGNNIVDTQFVQMDVPAQTLVTGTYSVVFGTGLDAPNRVTVRAEVVVGDVPDPTCNGTGRIPLNAWPFVDGLRVHFNEVAREAQKFNPPVAIDWSNYIFQNE